MLDLDGFKSVNDTLGHAAGDQLLVGIAERLRRTVRSDSLVARISGDEFAVVLEDVEEPEVADDVGERILAAMRAPFVIDDREVATSFSVGIAVAIAGEPPIDVLLRQADLAMYRAKHRAAGTLERFVPDADDVASVAQRVPRAS